MFRVLLVLLAAIAVVPFATGAYADTDAPELAFESYDLANGLHVILAPDPMLPEVAVNLWYHVGSRNERPGRHGFAHVYEHLMFKGSAHHDRDLLPTLEAIGGRGNGMTNKDRTVYWSVVPPSRLETALWLEADRMGFLPGALTQEKLDNQISVILNELRQNADRPYARTDELVTKLLFAPEHPYSWTVAGVPEELAAAALVDVTDFFRTFYVPNNASLCVAGNFDPARTREWIAKYFGALPSGPPQERLTAWLTRLDGERRLTAEDDVSLPRLVMAWHTPARFRPGDADCDVLAFILGARSASRLRRALQHDAQLAQSLRVRQRSRELGSTFEIEVTAAPGVNLARIETTVDGVLAEIRDRGVHEREVQAACAMLEADFVRGLEQVGGFGGRANRLNRYQTFLGRADWLAEDWLRLQRVTAKSVRQAVVQWLDPDRRAVVHIVPGARPKAAQVDVERQGGSPAVSEVVGRPTLPPAVTNDTFTAPGFVSGSLDNGLRYHIVRRAGLPLVEVHVNVRAGWSADRPDLPGAAALTAEMLDEGAAGRSALEIADRADRLGAILECGSNFDAALVRLNVTSVQLADGLDLVADVVRKPDFPADAFERIRTEMKGRARAEAKRPRTSAIRELQKRIFGPHHPYRQPYTGTASADALERIDLEALQAVHATCYQPERTEIVFVGDVEPDAVRRLLRKTFGSWRTEPSAAGYLVATEGARPGGIVVLDRPGSRQTTIVGGTHGVPRTHPDREALLLVNQAFGRTDAGRLGRNLRAGKGLTYQIRSRLISYREDGFFLIESAVDPARAAEALVELKRELEEIGGGRPLVDDELATAQVARLAGFARGFETLKSTATNLDRLLVCGLPLDTWENIPQKITACTPDRLRELAAEHLAPEQMTWIVVGDWQAMRPQFEARGLEPVEVRDF